MTLFLVFVYRWVEVQYGGFSALVSVIAIVTYPLFYGESHFNVQKDIPEAVYLTASGLVFYTAFLKQSVKWIVVAGLLAGMALGTKFNIAFLVPVVVAWALTLGIGRFIGRITKAPRNFLIAFLCIPIIAFGIYFISWPWLWQNPVQNILASLGYYRTMGIVPAPSLPAEYYFLGLNIYAFQWVFYTTPLAILILAFFGTVAIFVNWKKEKNKTSPFVLLLFLVPIARVSFPFVSWFHGKKTMEQCDNEAVEVGFANFGNCIIYSHHPQNDSDAS